MKRLLPDFFRPQTDHPAGSGPAESLNSALRSLHEPEIIEAKREAAQRLLNTVPQSGGKFELTEDDAHAWAAAVNDMRLALGTMLEVAQDGPAGTAARASDGGPSGRVPVADGAAGVSGARNDGEVMTDECDHRRRRNPRRPPSPDRSRCRRSVRVGPAGTTVVLTPPGTVGAVDCRGGAPGTRETDLLDPINSVRHVDAVVLSGGSAFGLAAARRRDGVARGAGPGRGDGGRRGADRSRRGDFRPSGRWMEVPSDCGVRSSRRRERGHRRRHRHCGRRRRAHASGCSKAVSARRR